MSKEREMIEKLCSFQMTYSDWLLLIADAEELLAQPEQEPVAWKVIDETNDGAFSFSEVKPMERYYKDYVVIPLYTAPLKREPFEPEERQRLSKAYSTRAEQVAFEEGIIFAEISYGIGEG